MSVTSSILIIIEETTNLVGNVHPRFVRECVPAEDNIVTTTSEVWVLVYLQPNAMAQSVGEVLLPAVRLQYCPGGFVRDPCECPVFGSFQCGSLSVSNSIPNLELSIGKGCPR